MSQAALLLWCSSCVALFNYKKPLSKKRRVCVCFRFVGRQQQKRKDLFTETLINTQVSVRILKMILSF